MLSLESIAPEFASFVAERDLKISSEVNSDEFGDLVLVLDSPLFALRFISDKGQRFVDIGIYGSPWYKLEHVLEFLDRTCTQEWLGQPADFKKLALVLSRQFGAMSSLLEDSSKKLALENFVAERFAEMQSRVFGEAR